MSAWFCLYCMCTACTTAIVRNAYRSRSFPRLRSASDSFHTEMRSRLHLVFLPNRGQRTQHVQRYARRTDSQPYNRNCFGLVRRFFAHTACSSFHQQSSGSRRAYIWRISIPVCRVLPKTSPGTIIKFVVHLMFGMREYRLFHSDTPPDFYEAIQVVTSMACHFVPPCGREIQIGHWNDSVS